jgi:hypothetical protein
VVFLSVSMEMAVSAQSFSAMALKSVSPALQVQGCSTTRPPPPVSATKASNTMKTLKSVQKFVAMDLLWGMNSVMMEISMNKMDV